MPPDEVFDAALQKFLAQQRVDMRALAAELGIGRATLYRRAGGRDQVLGHVLWYLTDRNLDRAVRAAEGRTGAERITAVIGHFLNTVKDQPSLRHFLATEPEAALRILTSKRGIVQGRVVDHLEALMHEEIAAGNFSPRPDARTLAFVLVRIGESFLYADAIADGEPDVEAALDVIGRLLSG
ncbi:QsdR family transcriptional regulator [Dactylosporangium sp. NPDC051541]|uniref:QsdR family transcriptional regulator n=1 Tax=Dactylosporangium sp. NPDC051541 TaxID=3363977 RepID=UPI00378790C3